MPMIAQNALQSTLRHILPDLIILRHELHQHPEIRFQEHWTSDRIARFLDTTGVPYTRGHAGGTGLIATIDGEADGKGDTTVVLRADIDALEIQEATGLPY
ncbi:MAG: amidohydrolase, partial [Candidatus Hydrogenedentes bacterium]|nr:amidohydrolase [Candidatus Hydrogenedentota bacterium]